MINERLAFGGWGELQIQVSSSFQYDGRIWDYRADPLPAYPSSSLSVRMCEHSVNGWRPDFYLDYFDILKHETARMHIYPDRSRQVPFDIKLQRIKDFENAIKAFDSVMQDFETPLSKRQIEQTVRSGFLPRPDIVQLSTDSTGLTALLNALNFPFDKRSGEFTPKWKDFVHQAASGNILNIWLSQKSRTG